MQFTQSCTVETRCKESLTMNFCIIVSSFISEPVNVLF